MAGYSLGVLVVSLTHHVTHRKYVGLKTASQLRLNLKKNDWWSKISEHGVFESCLDLQSREYRGKEINK